MFLTNTGNGEQVRLTCCFLGFDLEPVLESCRTQVEESVSDVM